MAHLPSLEIREGAIDRLVRIYKDTVDKTRGYLCKDGFPDLKKVQRNFTCIVGFYSFGDLATPILLLLTLY